MQKAGGAKGCPFLSLIRRRANPGRGTIHRALRNRYWRLAVGGWRMGTLRDRRARRSHAPTFGRPSAALCRDAVPTLPKTERHHTRGNRRPDSRPEAETLSGPGSRPSGIWYGFSGTGSGVGHSAICPLSSIQPSTLSSILPSIQSSILPNQPRPRSRVIDGGPAEAEPTSVIIGPAHRNLDETSSAAGETDENFGAE